MKHFLWYTWVGDFAFTDLVLSMDDADLVVFADRDRAGLRWGVQSMG